MTDLTSTDGSATSIAEVPAAAGSATKETLEDYTLRFAPRSYRRWTPRVVATSALGGIAYMADFSIGANIGIAHGTGNALLGIALAAVVIFVTGFPLAYYAARYNIDLDLITRGSGFGYYGSVLTSVIFASFTFIFFALEGSIMAQGLQLGLGTAVVAGLRDLHAHGDPAGDLRHEGAQRAPGLDHPALAAADGGPAGLPGRHRPRTPSRVPRLPGARRRRAAANTASVLLGAGVCLSLIAQIGEQIDYLRFMPPKTEANRRAWWTAVVMAGPGLGGASARSSRPSASSSPSTSSPRWTRRRPRPRADPAVPGRLHAMMPSWLVIPLAVVLVVISQIKINVTNAYSGSLAWTNSFTRVTKHYPGRMVFVLVNLGFALVLMEADMFSFLNSILGFYSNCAIAWVVTVATDIAINKYLLKLSPQAPEFRRGMLYAVNPVGFVAFLAASGLSIAVYFHALGDTLQPYSPVAAAVHRLRPHPADGRRHQGQVLPAPHRRRHRRSAARRGRQPQRGDACDCHVCRQDYERPDLAACRPHDAVVCSLCLSTDRVGDHVLPAEVRLIGSGRTRCEGQRPLRRR